MSRYLSFAIGIAIVAVFYRADGIDPLSLRNAVISFAICAAIMRLITGSWR